MQKTKLFIKRNLITIPLITFFLIIVIFHYIVYRNKIAELNLLKKLKNDLKEIKKDDKRDFSIKPILLGLTKPLEYNNFVGNNFRKSADFGEEHEKCSIPCKK
jgi:hypothetical protein